MSQTKDNSNAFLLHLSSFSGYFIPFGAIIVPLIIWEMKRKKDDFLDKTGKDVINFNLSFLLYSIVIMIIMASLGLEMFFNILVHENLFVLISLGIALVILSIVKFILIILGAIQGNQGALYTYPLSIKFIK